MRRPAAPPQERQHVRASEPDQRNGGGRDQSVERAGRDGAVVAQAQDGVVEESGLDVGLKGGAVDGGGWGCQRLADLADVQVQVDVKGGAEYRRKDEEREGVDRDADERELCMAAVDEEVGVLDAERGDQHEGEIGQKSQPVPAADRR